MARTIDSTSKRQRRKAMAAMLGLSPWTLHCWEYTVGIEEGLRMYLMRKEIADARKAAGLQREKGKKK